MSTNSGVATMPAIARPRLNLGGVKSFIAHVVGVSAGVVIGLAAGLAFATEAPETFAVVAGVATLAVIAGMGARLGDTWYHWARGESAGGAKFADHLKTHFSGVGA